MSRFPQTLYVARLIFPDRGFDTQERLIDFEAPADVAVYEFTGEVEKLVINEKLKEKT